MPRFIFVCEHVNLQKQTVESKSTADFAKENMSDILVQFECFLRGAGYVFDGTIEYVPAKTVTEAPKDHDESYYDTDRNK